MEQSVPGLRIGTFGLAGFPLAPFPWPSQTKFSNKTPPTFSEAFHNL